MKLTNYCRLEQFLILTTVDHIILYVIEATTTSTTSTTTTAATTTTTQRTTEVTTTGREYYLSINYSNTPNKDTSSTIIQWKNDLIKEVEFLDCEI